MNLSRLIRKYWKVTCVIVGCWTFLALLFTPETYLSNLRSPTPLTWGRAFFATLMLFQVWAVLTPLIFWLGRRFPFERYRLFRNLAVHLLLSGPIAVAHIGLLQIVNRLLFTWSRTYEPPVPVSTVLVTLGAANIMIYWGIVAASQAVNYFRKYQEREFRLAQAQLQALRMQLHPHFLFNTLNAIAELVHSDPKAADRCIVSVSELLRFSLESHRTQEVTLKEEIDFLEKYLEIQQTLMRERLRVRLNVEPEALDASVPNMLLQPLVENAIKHGISPRPEGGNIEVYARRLDGKLYVEIADDGLGMHEQPDGNGVGLVNTRERLKHLYGHAHAFNVSSFPGRGVTIRISLPFREAESKTDDTNADY
jgi:signal transduction histidine kinase